MSLLDEYGDRREQKGRDEGWRKGKKEGMKELISSLLNSGESLSEIAKKNWKVS